MLFIIKITKYNLFYNYKIQFILQIYKIKKQNLFYKHIQFIFFTHKYIQLQNRIYFTNTYFFSTHKYIQLQNRIHFTFTLVNIQSLSGMDLLKRFVLNPSSSYKVSKSMAFVFGGMQKDLDSTHLLRHSTSSSLSLQNLITCLSMQALANSSSCDQ